MPHSSDSATSSSSEGNKKAKSSKKPKKKSGKKRRHEKKHKKQSKHRTSSSDEESSIKNSRTLIPARFEELTEGAEVFGAPLPPHLLKTSSTAQEPSKPLIGPSLPKDFKPEENQYCEENDQMDSNSVEDDIGTYGPLPNTVNEAQIELEERALKLKMAAMDGIPKQNEDQTVREEWMLELPEVGLKGGLAALSNMKRTFHHGKERPDFSDRSDWTKTPQSEGMKATTSKVSAETLKNKAKADYERMRDEEQERIAKRHKKKHKRDESLVEIHQKKLLKERKKKEKELAASGCKPERRPFSRDVDLKLNKIDKDQTKQIVDKAKILDSKFSTGHRKYL